MVQNTAFEIAEQKIKEAYLTNATQLDLSCGWDTANSQKLSKVPTSMGRLTQLEKLDLAGNKLISLPECMSRLTQLQSLDLGGNQLTSVPECLRQLTQLQKLNLGANRLTNLPEWLTQLPQLKSLDLRGIQLGSLPEWLSQLTQLQRLDLRFNRLTSLPDSVGLLPQLQTLDVEFNRINELPESLCQLTQLQNLGIGFNLLSSLPEFLSQLTQLEKLSIGGSRLTSLPEWFGQLTQLRSLGLEYNRLSSLPEFMGLLVKIQSLDLGENQLETLPEWLNNLTRIQVLDLRGNKLVSLPECVGQLKKLERLDLRDNLLTTIPDYIGQLTELQSLDLGSNPLERLPERLRQLRKLTTFNINSIQLTSLPEWLSELRQLQRLDLGGNQLSCLPDFVGKLTRLQSLELESNQITSLPECVGQLTQLQLLDLRNNKLTSLPEGFGLLTELQSLNLAGNKLKSMPNSVGRLMRLQSLDLGNNQLSCLPDVLGDFTQLQSLGLGGNQLTNLPECLPQFRQLQNLDIGNNQLNRLPDFLGQLTQLQNLILQNNQITVLPDSVGQLTNLQTLDLGRNQLTSLPDSLGQLKLLLRLDLGENLLTSLPECLSQLTQLHMIDLEGNQLNPELEAAYEQGLDALIVFLKAKAEDQIVLNEAKLILIGEGEVGKTSLLGALRDDPWVEKRKTTRGVEVDIKSLILTDSDSGTEITFNGWDFGGQNIYRPTHQLYFTAPAVYLAVWNPRRGPEQCCVDEWIRMVKHRAFDEDRSNERPRILVVATHGGPGERLAHIDEQQLRDEFGDLIVGFHHVDSKNGDGVSELKSSIAHTAVSIPSVGRKVPTTWKNMLEALRKRSRKDPYITIKQYRNICRRHKISHDLASTYAAILNELGHLIHYNNDSDLQDIVILKPEWLSKAMSYVLEDEQVMEQNGLVSHNRLSEIWEGTNRSKQERYPNDLHPVFLKLMEQYDLSYRVVLPEANTQETILIAQLVPGGRPSGWDQAWPEKPSKGDSERTQICRIVDSETGRTNDVEGLLYRLIVRLHRYSLGRRNYYESRHWKTGMILDDGPNGRAFIEEIGGDIYVKVRAAYPERFLHLLCEEVRWLVSYFWRGLNCLYAVPCDLPCKGLLELDEMYDNLKEGIDKIRCPVCRKYHSISGKLSTSTPKPTVNQVLDELKQGQKEILHGMETGFAEVSTNLRRLISLADEQFAALMTTLTDPAKAGPRLFSFESVDPGFFDKPKWVAQKFRLTLWCEHARLPLPILADDSKCGVYDIELTRDWLKKSAPLLKVLSATLSLALPVAAPAAKIVMDQANYDAIEDQLKFGKVCAESLLKGSKDIGEWLTGNDELEANSTRELLAEGSALRELHAILKVKDPTNNFGGLVQVQDKKYNFFWVHEKFKSEYN